MIGGLLIGFLTALLYCAVVILVAFAFVWGLKILGINLDGEVYKWGKIAVGLICLIIMLSWLLGTLGMVGGRTLPKLSGFPSCFEYINRACA